MFLIFSSTSIEYYQIAFTSSILWLLRIDYKALTVAINKAYSNLLMKDPT
jgi:hypothetical protein